MILGITGGMGCGKSTAAKLFERHGWRRLDADAMIRDQVLADPAVLGRLRERFGPDVIGADGKVDRPKLAERVFASPEDLAWLEQVTHPELFRLWRAAFAAEPGVKWAVEVPLLFEKKLENWFDFTVCVACAPAQQLARLEQRGFPRALAEQRLSKQLPLAHKIEQADFVLWNDGAAVFLEAEVARLSDALSAHR